MADAFLAVLLTATLVMSAQLDRAGAEQALVALGTTAASGVFTPANTANTPR